MESMTSGNPMVDAIGRLDFNGNIISRKYSMICLAEDGKKKIQCDGILLDTVELLTNLLPKRFAYKKIYV